MVAFNLFQSPDTGNCMFHALKESMDLRRTAVADRPYFPCRYLRRDLVAWMVNHRDYVMAKKEAYLASEYGVDGDNPKLSYARYLLQMLKRTIWGDNVTLQCFSKQHEAHVTVLVAGSLDERRFRHNAPLERADFVLVYNGHNHYMAAGKWSPLEIYWSSMGKILVVACRDRWSNSAYWSLLACWSPM